MVWCKTFSVQYFKYLPMFGCSWRTWLAVKRFMSKIKLPFIFHKMVYIFLRCKTCCVYSSFLQTPLLVNNHTIKYRTGTPLSLQQPCWSYPPAEMKHFQDDSQHQKSVVFLDNIFSWKCFSVLCQKTFDVEISGVYPVSLH